MRLWRGSYTGNHASAQLTTITPPYSTDIKAAWEILETLVSRGYGVSVSKDDAEEAELMEEECRGWHCNFSSPKGEYFSDGYGPTASSSICKAFLALEGK